MYARPEPGGGFEGVAHCECGMAYTSRGYPTETEAIRRVALYAASDGWEVELPAHVVCPWCGEAKDDAKENQREE